MFSQKLHITAKVSVIIPVYNCASCIERCIDSLFSQTMQEWEAIFVNDGSIDNSAQIIQSYAEKDPRICLINKTNGGAASARNKGLDIARTKYITMMDADDYIPSSALESLCTAAESTNCDLVIAAQTQHCDDGRIRTNKFPCEGFMLTNPRFLFRNVYRGPVAKLYRKDIIERYHLRMPEDMPIAEDYVFVTSYWTRAKNIYVIPNSLYTYLYQENNTSLIHRFCNKELDFMAYKNNAEAAWRTFNFLIREETDKNIIEAWTYELYRDLWKMTANSCRYLANNADRNKLRKLLKIWDRHMAEHISIIPRILMIHRYPALAHYLLRLKYLLKKIYNKTFHCSQK